MLKHLLLVCLLMWIGRGISPERGVNHPIESHLNCVNELEKAMDAHASLADKSSVLPVVTQCVSVSFISGSILSNAVGKCLDLFQSKTATRWGRQGASHGLPLCFSGRYYHIYYLCKLQD